MDFTIQSIQKIIDRARKAPVKNDTLVDEIVRDLESMIKIDLGYPSNEFEYILGN